MRTSRLDVLLTLWFMALITLVVVKVFIPAANSILNSPPQPLCYTQNSPPASQVFYILPISSTSEDTDIHYN